MKRRFTIDQIVRILAEAKLPGSSAQKVARKYGISPDTIYNWRSKYKGLSALEARRFKVLEEENARLKRLLAEKEPEEIVMSPESFLKTAMQKAFTVASGKNSFLLRFLRIPLSEVFYLSEAFLFQTMVVYFRYPASLRANSKSFWNSGSPLLFLNR